MLKQHAELLELRGLECDHFVLPVKWIFRPRFIVLFHLAINFILVFSLFDIHLPISFFSFLLHDLLLLTTGQLLIFPLFILFQLWINLKVHILDFLFYDLWNWGEFRFRKFLVLGASFHLSTVNRNIRAHRRCSVLYLDLILLRVS